MLTRATVYLQQLQHSSSARVCQSGNYYLFLNQVPSSFPISCLACAAAPLESKSSVTDPSFRLREPETLQSFHYLSSVQTLKDASSMYFTSAMAQVRIPMPIGRKHHLPLSSEGTAPRACARGCTPHSLGAHRASLFMQLLASAGARAQEPWRCDASLRFWDVPICGR